MKTKTRSILVLIGALLIGAFIGVISSNLIYNKRLDDRIRGFRNPDKFIERIEKVIEPTEAQREKLREILYAHHDKFVKTGKEFRSRMKANSDSLKAKLENILTDEQNEKMKSLFKRRERGKPHERNSKKEEER